MKIKRLLVPVDFSETSLEALDYAVDFAKPFRATLTVLFVVEPVYYATPTELYGPAANWAVLSGELQRIGRQQLAELAERLKKRRVSCRTVLRTGTPYRIIVDEAKKQRADLIVMSTHGRTGLSHLVMGSVTEKVVRAATCPVLTVRGGPGARRRRRA